MSNERVVCAACGSNNFATQAACWKCGRALVASVARPAYALPTSESPAAFWSSVAIGIFFPIISIPVGLVFLMLDDKRKTQIGWWNILFGLLGTVLNGIVVMVSLAPLVMNATRMIPGLGGRGAAQSQDMNSEVAPLEIPGQRPFATPPR
ncbi:hypothetical protein [Armatimonas sp.]|uniref:hypothetical protein n=1 Tax=Armatimonas sp. TaxID=1872638 RepID=UPI0037501DC5